MEILTPAILILVIALVIMSVNDLVVSHESHIAIDNQIGQLIKSQQQLLANNYLITSNNNLLLKQSNATNDVLQLQTENQAAIKAAQSAVAIANSDNHHIIGLLNNLTGQQPITNLTLVCPAPTPVHPPPPCHHHR